MCIKKDYWSLSNRTRTWNFTSFIAPYIRLAICYWYWHCNCRACLAILQMIKIKKITNENLKVLKKQLYKYSDEKGSGKMTIVVKKVPKCLKGIVKLLFGIKEK